MILISYHLQSPSIWSQYVSENLKDLQRLQQKDLKYFQRLSRLSSLRLPSIQNLSSVPLSAPLRPSLCVSASPTPPHCSVQFSRYYIYGGRLGQVLLHSSRRPLDTLQRPLALHYTSPPPLRYTSPALRYTSPALRPLQWNQ